MAKIRVSVGTLPLGVEDIEPSTDGTNPSHIATPRESVSNIVPLIFWCDTTGYKKESDLIIPGMDGHVRMSVDGVTWGAWGEGITVTGPITTSGTAAYLQTRGFSTDTTPLAVKLVVEQSGIVQYSDTNIPINPESMSNADIGEIIKIGMLEGMEFVTASDNSVMSYGGLISNIPSGTEIIANTQFDTSYLRVFRPFSGITDAIGNSDNSTIIGVLPLGTATEAGANADAGALDALLHAPSLSSVTAGDARITFTLTDDVTGETEFDVRAILASNSSEVAVWHNCGTGALNTYGHITLSNGTAYKLQARSVNAVGDGAWGTASASVTPAVVSSWTGTVYATSSPPTMSATDPVTALYLQLLMQYDSSLTSDIEVRFGSGTWQNITGSYDSFTASLVGDGVSNSVSIRDNATGGSTITYNLPGTPANGATIAISGSSTHTSDYDETLGDWQKIELAWMTVVVS